MSLSREYSHRCLATVDMHDLFGYKASLRELSKRGTRGEEGASGGVCRKQSQDPGCCNLCSNSSSEIHDDEDADRIGA